MDLANWLNSVKVWAGSWPKNAATWFAAQYGLDVDFAIKVAQLYIALFAAKLNPQVTSGWRDPAKQKAMMDAWDRGDKQGLAVRPADPSKSLHTSTSLGRPAAKAIDIKTSNPKLAADIARVIGLRAGFYFSVPDPVHFDLG